jgi:anti-sigma factor ChrR (cupin superfamily)
MRAGCHHWYTSGEGGSVKREAEAARGADGALEPLVALAGTPGTRVAWRPSPWYLQQKKGRVEQWGEPQD